MAGERDFMLDSAGRMIIRNGTFLTGESLTQEVGLVLITNQGEIRNDALCGCNLVRRMNSRVTRGELERIMRLQLERDGKNWGAIKAGINIHAQ